MRSVRSRAVFLLVLGAAASASAQRGTQPQGRFQEPTEERRIEVAEDAESSHGNTRRETGASDLEASLYLRERPDALGAAAREFHDAQLEVLLESRERLLVERRATAIRLLEEFIREEPEDADEMPDALLRLAELRWEEERARYLTAFAAWQESPPETRPAEPPAPDYSVSVALHDRILTRHRDYPRYDLVLYMKAFAMAESGRPDLAIALYRRILDEFPQSRFVPDSHMALAEARFSEADFTGALARYEEVLRFRESDLYGLALFKSAWCLWRMSRNTDAARRFREVLDLGRGGGRISADQRQRLRELQSEALEYLIQVFTEEESNTAAHVFAFLEEIGGERYADRVLMRLAARFYEQDRWDRGVEAYRLLLERMPNDERAPRWQLAVVQGEGSLGDPERTIAALTQLASSYGADSAWARAQSDRELVGETSTMIERAVRTRAMRWHDLAQRENQRPLFERAERVYGIYLEHFGTSEQSYDLRFYRAEILFHRLERWDDAGQSYLAAAQQNPTGRYTRDALYNAIGAFERVREAQLERCGTNRAASQPQAAPPARDPAAQPGAQPAIEDPCAESENDRRFGAAIELYVQQFPTDPDLPEILFRQGRLYYDRQIFDPAVRLFGQLLERFPQSPYAVTAGELILESFNRAQDYQNIEAWARRLKSSPAFATEESQRRLDTLILQAVFATGEQLAGRGEHGAAADAYLRAAREFPRDERAPQAYHNAGVEYQRAGNLGGATTAYEQLIEHHAGSPIGAQGAWAAAQMYESIAQFSDAARFYEAYGEHFPRAERGADALFNATLLRVTAGEHDRAVQNGQRFLERFARDDSAAEVTFLMGRAHAAAGRHREAAEVYQRFIRSTRDTNREIEAGTRLAQVLLDAGDREGSARALSSAVRTAGRSRGRLNDQGLYYAAQARFMEAEDLLRQYSEIQIAGPMDGLRQRLERKSELLRRAAEAFASVVELHVAEWVTAALFQIGRSYELYAQGLREAPIPEGLTEEEETAYTDQLAGFIVPIEERALEAFEGGYQTALELRIFNRWTANLREGLTRLNDVQYPPFREMGAELADAPPIPMPRPLEALRRGESVVEASVEAADRPARAAAPAEPGASQPATDEPAAPAASPTEAPRARPARPRRRRR
jgi:TolA-binding protein